MAIGWVFYEFSEWTSASGIPHIGSAGNLFLRGLWTVVFLGCFGMFLFQTYILVDQYLDYDVSVQTEVRRKHIACTYCLII